MKMEFEENGFNSTRNLSIFTFDTVEAGPLPEGRSTLALLFSTLTCSVSLCARHSKYTLKLDHKFILSFRIEAKYLLPQ